MRQTFGESKAGKDGYNPTGCRRAGRGLSWHGITNGVEVYNRNHSSGGNLLWCDGHAKWKAMTAQRSGDFGLTPDQVYTTTNGTTPDGGGAYKPAL